MIGRGYRPLERRHVHIDDGFWSDYIKLLRDYSIPYMWKALNDEIPNAEKSHAFENYRIAAGLGKGFFHGLVFQDSDVTKWLEGAALYLANGRDEDLEKLLDEVIQVIEKAQGPDGYLDNYFTLEAPGMRWKNLEEGHELYCAGHLIEAAVAYYQATGKDKLLKVACKLADLIGDTFGPEKGKLNGYGGHPEIELALVKLFEVTQDEAYLGIAQYFIQQRGQSPLFFAQEANRRDNRHIFHNLHLFGPQYAQAHEPVYQQQEAVGHAVRALYLYTGMVDVAKYTDDQAMLDAVRTLWDDIVQHKMYITGAVGATEFGEAFSIPYDLPNDRAYAETCASIGMMMLASRLLRIELNGKYADVMERELYNVVLSGMALDGRSFFYVNPLEVYPELCARHDTEHVLPQRQKWFACSCCPPNVIRTLMDIGSYAYSCSENALNIHLYVGSSVDWQVNGSLMHVRSKGDFLRDGKMKYRISAQEPVRAQINLRLPAWSRDTSIILNGERLSVKQSDGYACIDRVWSDTDEVEISFDMRLQVYRSNLRVRANAGKVALGYGPLIYCVEEVDNGPDLHLLRVDTSAPVQIRYEADLLGGVTTIWLKGDRLVSNTDDALYSSNQPYNRQPCQIKMIPYYAWSNRGENEMRVWLEEMV